MEMLKQKEKDIVSGANVAMPASFLKPLDYSIDLLVRTHPTLRQYERQVSNCEVDPEYKLYPAIRQREELKDEIVLKNVKKDKDISFVKSLSKSISGAFVNELSISSQEIPGNFGVRVIETMPTNIRNVFIDQRNNLETEFRCDYRQNTVPELLGKPDENDYLTDDESDDAAEFDVKVPELNELIDQFEAGDETIHQFNENQKTEVKDLELRGFQPEARQQIINKKEEQINMLNENISKQRQQQVTQLPGLI